MITITIEAQNVIELHAKLRGVLFGDDVTRPPEDREAPVNKDAEPEKPKAPRSTKAKPSPEKEPATTVEEPIASNEPSSSQDSSGSASTAEPTASDEPLDPVEVKKRGFRYAQKAGPQAATELIVNAGAENGKFEELDEAGLARLAAALDELGY